MRRVAAAGLALIAIGVALAVVQGRVAAAPPSELPRYTFTVQIEGTPLGTFRQVSGLAVETEVIEFREGGGGTTILLPGNTKYSPIKLSRAFTGDPALWDWYSASAQAGHVTRVGGTISVLDQSGRPVATYSFSHAWPRKYEGPTLNAGSNDVPIESIEIAHDGLTR